MKVGLKQIMSEVSVATATINKTATTGSEVVKTAINLELGKTTKPPRIIRNFTYELHDVEDIFTSKISFFLEELNKQINALVSSSIYTENKEKLDKVLKSKGEFRKELLHLLKTKYTDFYHQYYFEAEIFGNKAKYFRTVIEEYRRILLSRLSRQTVIDIIVNNPNITYQEVFNKLCELNERRSSGSGSQRSSGSNSATHYKFNWISKAEFNNIIKQLKNLASLNNSVKIDHVDDVSVGFSEITEQVSEADVYAIDYSSEDNQISELNLTDNDEYYFIEFKLKYSDYTTHSDSLLTYSCKVPKKQIKGLATGYTKLQKFTRPRIFLSDADSVAVAKLYISFNYELLSGEASESKVQVKSVDLQDTWQFKTMGIDIGVAKSATAAIITTNMCWAEAESRDNNGEGGAKTKEEVKQQNSSAEIKLVPAIDFTQPAQLAISNELTISDKTKSVSEHIEILKEEQNYIYKKEKAIYDLLKLKQFDGNASETATLADKLANNVNVADELVNHASIAKKQAKQKLALLHKYQRLNKHRLHLRSKVSNLKKELSFLTARDMISHAIDNEVDLITMEKLSWIRDEHHVTWDYNQIQQRIIHEANIYGIKVKKVSCAYSSAHNPLTLEKEEVDQNRKLVKCLFDRDYTAAIILARRGIKLGKRKLKLSLSCEAASHINESFQAVNYSIKPSLKYRQLKLCAKRQKSISAISVIHESNFAYYSIL